jgi:SulP family sulfate permease
VYVFTPSQEVRLVQITSNPDGTYREGPSPAELPGRAVTLLQIDGNLFFAAADRLEGLLPSPKNADRPVVILRLRAYESVSSTFINVLERYAQQVRERGGRLMLTGVRPNVKAQLDRTETTEEDLGLENVFVAPEIIGGATRMALEIAHRWLEEEKQDGEKEP